MNRNFLKHLLLIIIFGIGNALIAQEDIKGSIITLDDKKVEGIIKSWDIGTNPFSVSFKAHGDTNFVTYMPNEIKLFIIEGEYHECYEGGTFDVELSSTDPDKLSDTSLLILEKQTAFLQVLYLGPKSLYVYRNMIKDQFYIKQDNKFELLVYKKFNRWKLIGNEHRKLVYENKKFQGQLSVYLENNDPVNKELLKTDYEEYSISDLFEIYYQTNQVSHQIFISEKNSFIKPGVVLGVGILTMDYSLTLDEIEGLKLATETLPLVGVTIELPLGIRRCSMFGELILLGGYQTTYKDQPVIGETFKIEKVYSCSFKNKKFTGMFRYRVPLKKITYFGNIGASIQTLRGNIDETKSTYLNGNLSTVNNHSFESKNTAFRISTGAGARINRLSIEARVEPSFDKYQKLMTSILLNYYFGKVIK